MTIRDNKKLYQWDQNVFLDIPEAIDEVHFSNQESENALVVKVKEGAAAIPNELLQQPYDILAYGFDDTYTKFSLRMPVIGRMRPADYIYTPTEVYQYETILKKVEDIDSHIDAAAADYISEHKADFKGDTGPQGEPGVEGVNFKQNIDYAANLTVPANIKTHISTLTGPLTLTLGEGKEDLDNYWAFSIKQGAAAQSLTLPAINWTLGIAPAFAANSKTVVWIEEDEGKYFGSWYEVD